VFMRERKRDDDDDDDDDDDSVCPEHTHTSTHSLTQTCTQMMVFVQNRMTEAMRLSDQVIYKYIIKFYNVL
jgi:hypothetical protein